MRFCCSSSDRRPDRALSKSAGTTSCFSTTRATTTASWVAIGAVVAWPERYHADELSAIQHAFNLKLKLGSELFEAEYQNTPVNQLEVDLGFLTADQIANKTNNFDKGKLPNTVQDITAAIDVQGNSLWWLVTAWSDGFTGYVCDYGCFPKQNRRHFHQRERGASPAKILLPKQDY